MLFTCLLIIAFRSYVSNKYLSRNLTQKIKVALTLVISNPASPLLNFGIAGEGQERAAPVNAKVNDAIEIKIEISI